MALPRALCGSPQNDPAYADYTFTLTTTGSGDASGDNTSTPAAHAPLLTPTSLRIEAPPNGSEQTAFLRVGNPDDVARTYNASVGSPAGWSLRVDPTLTVAAHGNATLELRVSAASKAVNASSALFVSLGDLRAQAYLDLRVATDEPGSPPPDPTPTPAPLPMTAPTSGAPSTPAAPSSPAGITLRVEPATIDVVPDGRANGTLVLTNDGDAEATVTLTLAAPAGVSDDLLTSARAVAAHAIVRVPFTIHLVARFAPGATLEASAAARAPSGAASIAPAPFHILVVPPGVSGAAATTTSTSPPSSAPFVLALGAGAAVAAGGTALALTRRRWMLGIALLYTRLAPSRMAEQPRRARILEHLRETPGASLSELRRALGLANGALMHHVDLLERSGLVVSAMHGKERRVFLVGTPRTLVPEAPLPERIVDALATRGRTTQGELAAALGVSRQALHYHVKRLALDGKIVARVEGRELVLEAPIPAPRAAPASRP